MCIFDHALRLLKPGDLPEHMSSVHILIPRYHFNKRLLFDLREEKIISTSGSRIVIRDMDKLIRISEMYN